jgi:hypothetical protein
MTFEVETIVRGIAGPAAALFAQGPNIFEKFR